MRRLLPFAVLFVATIAVAHANEGMWQPAQLTGLSKTLKTSGLKLAPKSLADLSGYPLGAVVSLGGCSGSFVSKDGLIVTNHHCAYGALQYQSTAARNLIDEGFLAADHAAELRAPPGMRVYVTEKISDVTKQIEAGVHPWMTGDERYRAIERAEKKLVSTCESPGYRCRMHTIYDGVTYQLVKQLAINDVRLVYAPPQSIGKFGGNIDNWMWPRHTGDFAFLRAYVASDGRPAAYSKHNVPYHPKQVLKVNPKGLDAGDFVMVAGYPGHTNRHRLADEVAYALNVRYPARIKRYNDMLAIIHAAAAKDPQVNVTYASTLAGLNNYLKNFKGQIAGLRHGKVVADKRAEEAELAAWLKHKGGATNLARLADITKLRKAIGAAQANDARDAALALVTRPALMGAALRLVKLADARGKSDADREPAYQQRNWPRIKASLERMQRRFDPHVDRQFMVYGLEQYLALPDDQRLAALDDWLGHADTPKQLAAKVRKLYADSDLGQTKTRLQWFDADSKQIAASDDSLLELARALVPQLHQLRQQEHAASGTRGKLRVSAMKAMLAWKQAQNVPVYPDANGSLRVTFGSVQGVSPRDAVRYAPFSTVQGIVEKATGAPPFNAPQAELDAIKAKAFDGYASKKLGTLPVDFLADLDITGGNSGSPALDAHGRLVSLAFDGTWDSVSSDWLYQPKLNRSIQVDVRYMLWVMHHLDHADNLLREMGLHVPSD